MTSWNQSIIEEFRTNQGKVSGNFEGAPLLILHSTGARTGRPHVIPLMYQAVGDDLAIFASKGGASTNPDWYHNLVAKPKVTVEVGTETLEVAARVTEGEERERIWETQKERYPQFGEYERNTERQIPVLILERAD